MAIPITGKEVSDATAANQLDISLSETVTAGQVWKAQIAGVYHLIYPWVLGDFTHKKDINEWINSVYGIHTHPGAGLVNQVSPMPTTNGDSLLESADEVGSVRTGLKQLSTNISDIARNQGAIS